MKRFALQLLLALLFAAQYTPAYAQQRIELKQVKAHRVAPGDNGNPPPEPPAPGELFAGEWEWASGGEVFHLTLTHNSAYVFPEYPNDPPGDVVIGHFVYTRNGAIVDHSLTTGKNPFAAFGGPANNRSMDMQFYDHGTNGHGWLTLSFQANNFNKLNWMLVPEETAYRNPTNRPAVPFLVPTAMILTRK